MEDEESWIANWTRLSWFDRFVTSHPDAKSQSYLVLMDEFDFGVSLSHFEGISSDRGLEVTPKCPVFARNGFGLDME